MITNPWLLMELKPDTMTANFTDHRVAVCRRMVMNRLPHITKESPWFNLL